MRNAFKTPGWYWFVLAVLVILGTANSAYLIHHFSLLTALITCGLWIAVGTTIANIQKVRGSGPFKGGRR